MDKKNKYRIRSLADFIRYQKGDMTAEERNSFERDLQKDPFSEEAAEGFEMLTDIEAEKELSGLKKRLDKRTRKRSVIISYRIAASIAVLVAISVIFFNRNNIQEPAISKGNLEDTMKPDVIAATEPVTDKSETVVMAKGPESRRSEVPAPPGNKNPDVSTDTKTDTKEMAAEALQEQDEEAAAKGVVAGQQQVTEPEARKEKQIIAAAEDDNLSKLPEAEKKNEQSRVAGVSAPMAAKSSMKIDHTLPQPVTGLDSFNIYLEKKIVNPYPDSNKEEIVVIAFTVRKDSTLSNIRIISSPGKDYSNEAKRLLLKGPQWEPALKEGKPVNEDYQLRIRFR